MANHFQPPHTHCGVRDCTWADQNSWRVQAEIELRFPFDFKSKKEGRDGFTAVYLNWSIYIHLNPLSAQSLRTISRKMHTWKIVVNFEPEDLLFSSFWLKKCGNGVWPSLVLGCSWWVSHSVAQKKWQRRRHHGVGGKHHRGCAGEAERGQIQRRGWKPLWNSPCFYCLATVWAVEECQMEEVLFQRGHPTAVTMEEESLAGRGLWWTFLF